MLDVGDFLFCNQMNRNTCRPRGYNRYKDSLAHHIFITSLRRLKGYLPFRDAFSVGIFSQVLLLQFRYQLVSVFLESIVSE
jgi:hypothetical protein